MTIDTMRRIDRILGVPLCWILTVFERLRRLMIPTSRPVISPVQKILLIKLSEMGAITLTYPLVCRLREIFPRCEIHFLVFEKNAPAISLLSGQIKSSHVHTIKEGSATEFFFSVLRAIRGVRRERFDAAIDLEFFARCTAALTYLSGALYRAGFFRYHFEGLYRGDLLTHKLQYNPLSHCSVSYASLAEALRDKRKDSPALGTVLEVKDLVFPSFTPTEKGKQDIQVKLKAAGFQADQRIFLMNPGEGLLPLREWPIENFIALAQEILKDSRNVIILIGFESLTRKDKALEAALAQKRCLNLAGKTSIDELLHLFYEADVMISNDGGLVHLASLTTVAKFVFFGPESPQVFGPVDPHSHVFYTHVPCSPCLSAMNHRQSACRDNVCLKSISVAEVMAEVRKRFSA